MVLNLAIFFAAMALRLLQEVEKDCRAIRASMAAQIYAASGLLLSQ